MDSWTTRRVSQSVSLGWGLRTCVSNKRPCEFDADGQDHTLKITVIGDPQYSSPSNPTDPYLPTAPNTEWKILFMHVYYFSIFWKMENTLCLSSNAALTKQNSPRFSCFTPCTHPPLSFQFRPLSLHRWSGLCVCLYISSPACLHVHICIFPSPPLNYKVLECLSL